MEAKAGLPPNRLLKNSLLGGPWKARQIAQAQKAKQFAQDGKTTF
jgi:hypothetical protein